MKSTCCTLFIVLFAINLNAQQKARPAKQILAAAYEQAANSNKNVLIIFHASWCGWCRKMDSAINDENCKKFFYDNYIIEHLTVNESKGKEYLENAGAKEMLLQYKAGEAGIPVWLVMGKDGKLLGESFIRTPDKTPINVGCPANEQEVNWFIKMLQQTSALSAGQLTIIAKRFRQNEQ